VKDGNFLSRWSRRKLASMAQPAAPDAQAVPEPTDVVPPQAGAAAPGEGGAQSPQQPLPPLESLTPESDFTPFMQADVDPGTRRAALKTLFQDPQFNVMDGLDVYIDDYSKPDPIPEGWLDRMYQTARLGEYIDPDAEAIAKNVPDAPPPATQAVEDASTTQPPSPQVAENAVSEPGRIADSAEDEAPPPAGESNSRIPPTKI
jgi:hypothetical protein